MTGWYDRRGRPLHDGAAAKFLADPGYRLVARTTIDKEGQAIVVATVWVGRGPDNSEGRPLIFESTVMLRQRVVGEARYPSEEDAMEGHRQLCVHIGGGDADAAG